MRRTKACIIIVATLLAALVVVYALGMIADPMEGCAHRKDDMITDIMEIIYFVVLVISCILIIFSKDEQEEEQDEDIWE